MSAINRSSLILKSLWSWYFKNERACVFCMCARVRACVRACVCVLYVLVCVLIVVMFCRFNNLLGSTIYDFAKFSPKLHEIERIWTPGRGHVP